MLESRRGKELDERVLKDLLEEVRAIVIHSFQSVWAPIVENTYDALWNNWTSPRRAAEVYTRIVSNFADNVVTATRIVNNLLVANINAHKTFVDSEKDDVKEFSRIPQEHLKILQENSVILSQ